ncbi:hypothetical protein PVK06_027620 [Gossypium arboreum]|uniref:Uncharacterized protein n=1 Tax=Gossypium arboreum TaxID=29729 RepID=A0ABR0P0R2_GOSAR|nr:hypothetical protein PVK06_027620 [Gossypium arboreum]
MAVLIPIRKIINALKWERFCDARSLPDDELVREFYASLTTQDATEVIVRKKKVWEPFLRKGIPKTSRKDAIFETWMEDTDYTSEEEAKEDKGNESEK